MSKTTQFDDLGKDAKDLATRGFPAAGAFKVNHETKTPFGFVLKTNGVHDQKKGLKVTMENEYKWSIGGNAAIYKSKWDNTHVGEGSLAVSDLVSKGTEVKPWWKREIDASTKQHALSGGVLVGFANESANVQLKTTSASDFSKHVADANLVVQYPKGLYWGANVRATHAPKKEDKEAPKVAVEGTQDVVPAKSTVDYNLNVKVHHVQDFAAITAAFETDFNKKKSFGVTYFQTPTSDLKVATEFKILPAPAVTVTTDHKWDATTSLKTKLAVQENSRFGVAYSQKVSPFATAAFGADLNVTKLLGGNNTDADHGFGFELSLK